MIKTGFIFKENDLLASYYNTNSQEISENLEKEILHENPNLNKYNKLTEFYLDNQKINTKNYYLKFLNKKNNFLITFETDEEITEKLMQNISKDIKNFILNNYEREKNEGRIFICFTQYLKNILNQYEKENKKEQKIKKIESNLNILKEATQKNFKEILNRGENLYELSKEVLTVTDSSSQFYGGSYKLKKKIKMERLKSYVFCFISVVIGILFFYYYVF